MVEPPLELKPNIDESAIEQANVVEPDVEQPNVVEWKLSVICGEHNHEMAKTLEGHTLAGRLKPEEKECVQELTRNLVPPKNILTTLRGRNPDSKANMKQVYNARERTVGELKTIQDFFWAHPESVKLFNTFPTVLMMDSTYKTNKYKMHLFEIVGVTSTEDSFNVGFAFIANEKEDNFIWALETCKSLLKSKDMFPKVIVTEHTTNSFEDAPKKYRWKELKDDVQSMFNQIPIDLKGERLYAILRDAN
ncbi:hypothetical protein TSUD_298850 [Trifolium subterraneum]|nr:hypothetical protein TSUD_298850 [Trifolium subterraneum]